MLEVVDIYRVVKQTNVLMEKSKTKLVEDKKEKGEEEKKKNEEKAYQDIFDNEGNRILFQNLSFQLKPGEILAVQGQSGVGKTQILRGISQLDKFSGGKVTLNDKKPRNYGMSYWRARVGYVQQKLPLVEGTPREIFQMFCKMKAQKKWQKRRKKKGRIDDDSFKYLVGHLEEILREWNLDPNRLDQTWVKLSGGEHQRMCLAIAFALGPDVLLLDEPTSALDAETTLLVENSIKKSKTTCVWVTHSNDQALRVGDQLLFLERGAKHTLSSNTDKRNIGIVDERSY